MSKIFRLYGGIHPQEAKLASHHPIQAAPLLEKYTVPLQMHIGAPAKSLVQKGQKVLRGQLLAEPGSYVSAAIHSPVSGVIKEQSSCLSVSGTQWPALIIESDGEDQSQEPMPAISDWQEADPALLLKRVAEAGIVGKGGAAFPTHVKLAPPEGKSIDTLIINGVECEPGLSADHRLMLEKPEEIITGALIVARILKAKNIYLGIENNKPDALKLMRDKAAHSALQPRGLKVRYPQGAEKQLVYALTKRKVPSGGLPMDVGCVLQNVATVYAIYEAVLKGKPLYERVTTVTGDPVVSPGNFLLRIGSSYADALQLAGGLKEEAAKIISGGPMMGIAVYSLDIPVTKNCSGLMFLSSSQLSQFQSKACIRCARCNDACPMQLMPSILSTQIENERFELAETWNVLDCIECGCCAYVCPAKRPLVQHMRRAKTEVIAKRQSEAAKKTS